MGTFEIFGNTYPQRKLHQEKPNKRFVEVALQQKNKYRK